MPEKTVRAATLSELQASREIVAVGPSGAAYKIRPLNLERYALSGHLPAELRKIALSGATGVDAALGGDEDALVEHGEQVRDYMDDLVRQVVVEPDLAGVDLDELHPADYKWLVRIAMGEEDRDGEERRLWGREPLSVWGTFRAEHGCSEDCESCDRLRRSVAEIQRGRVD